MAGNERHTRAVGAVIRSTRKDELRTAVLSLIGRDHAKRIFGDSGAFVAELVILPDGSGPIVAYGVHSYLTENEFSHAKELKTDLNAQFGDDFDASVMKSTNNPGAPDFWTWAESLPIPLYAKVGTL